MSHRRFDVADGETVIHLQRLKSFKSDIFEPSKISNKNK